MFLSNNIIMTVTSGAEAWDLISRAFGPMVEGAIKYTIPLTLISFAFGLLIALLTAVMRLSSLKIVRAPAVFYVSAVRGTPLLVQLFIVFYGLPSIGLTIDPLPSAVIAFSLNVGAYASEIIRASISSIPKGQWEAGYTIGMGYGTTLRRIILPQATRVSIPPLSNTFISLVKDTSLASMILVTELFREAQEIASSTYEFMILYVEAAVLYWIICFILSLIQEVVERRLERYIAK
ncbi:amino acid ABC transporter permease [Gracilibacillus caseinilyticus]|uniref:Amino acid ABC transporter permease n=1 Tax=Gracilibacillus caseinilyticus TaxID=2932256 RepID=A0ABY4F1E5_9BACI|nr:amino acid ABC transporter permease [Gracilibacillus caseinilyticus]UOQ50041.1 amino acid ABC transporter permease [Gracilibacillus caseinilyticus]